MRKLRTRLSSEEMDQPGPLLGNESLGLVVMENLLKNHCLPAEERSSSPSFGAS
jgi:hypothetical protein